ncbi:alpha/beta hydrolase [uncultured Limosilactobacillus sp.]|uniref:alpha/beta hydrolase n=1 Tax=uncultured Limosilactobacillus sp. TaxID=2837629 RepID=UPI0025D5C5BD|nr:alpha/beta hydrolase [uncultured Limosilactobacillus sp.]
MLAKIGRSLLRIIIIIILIGGAVQLYLLRGSRSSPIEQTNPRVEYRSTPTLLIPGWGGNSWTYQKLIQTAQQKNIAQKAMTIWVAPNGHVRIKGNLNHSNPMIQLLYDWNYTPGYQAQTRQLMRVMKILHRNYHVQKMNIIAHSYGGTEWLHAYIGSPDLQKNIRFPKVILLGTPVDETFGERTKFTKWLFKKSKDDNFKLMERQIRHTSFVRIGHIYNWMGAKGGRTDGEVPHIQSEMLRSLIQNKRIHYSEHVYPRTNHIQLHQKTIVLNDLFKTLWFR